jgi:protein-S-isoprenylcysteine O-methyltransferase Ste14
VPPPYVTDRAMALIFWPLFAVWLASELVIHLRIHTSSHVRNRDSGSRPALIIGYWLAIVLSFAAAFTFPSATIARGRVVLFYIGIACLLAGFVLRQYAIMTLGRLHTLDVTTHLDQPVVEAGPYRLIRHPSYAGAMLTAAGILLCSTNWLSLAAYVLVVAVYAYRIRVEELALAQDLGEAYVGYMRRTKRFIPYLL